MVRAPSLAAAVLACACCALAPSDSAASEWEPVSAAASRVRLGHALVEESDSGFAHSQTNDYSADRHLAVYATAEYGPHRSVILYDALLPGYKYRTTSEPDAFIRKLDRIEAADPIFGETLELVSRNRRFAVRRFAFDGIECFAFVRYWGQAQIEFTGEGSRRVQGYVSGRRGAGMTDATVLDVLDGLSTRD